MVATRRSPRFVGWLCGALFGTAVLLSCSLAGAQSEADKDRAAQAMVEGDTRFKVKAYEQALESYRRADAIMNVPTTRLAVALALEKMGKLVQARETADGIALLSRPANEPRPFAKARVKAQELLAQLDTRIPSLIISVENAPEGVQVEVRMDGVRVGADRIATAQKVDPGPHRITAMAAGCDEAVETVALAEKDKKTVTLRLRPAAAKGGSSALPGGGKKPARSHGPVPTLAYVGFGVGGVLLAAGAVTGLLSMSATDDLKRKCGGTDCPRAYESDYNKARALGWTSNITFGLGVVGAGMGLAVLLLDRTKEPEAQPRPASGLRMSVILSPQQVGVQGRF